MIEYIPGVLIFGSIFFLIWLFSRRTPLFPMKCRDCNMRNRNWSIVATGHDDFGWQHNCENDNA